VVVFGVGGLGVVSGDALDDGGALGGVGVDGGLKRHKTASDAVYEILRLALPADEDKRH
jgi:hypothetical protein